MLAFGAKQQDGLFLIDNEMLLVIKEMIALNGCMCVDDADDK